MFTVAWKRVSDGKIVRSEEYDTAEEAIAEAQDPPIMEQDQEMEAVVSDENGVVLFPPPQKDA